MDERWIRWIWASIVKHFQAIAGDYYLHIDGMDTVKEGAELRMNGPFINHPQKYLWIIDVDINILFNVALDDTDAFKIFKIVGHFMNGYTDFIPVYKYGDDDTELLGCLSMRRDRGDDIVINHFGQMQPEVRMTQSTTNAIYYLVLDTSPQPLNEVVINNLETNGVST